jgi:ABC-type lipoprotein release transport system permease subunit
MGLFFTLAWRNLWRNKRRTTISIASVVSAVVFALAFNGLQLGQNELMIDSVVGLYTGYVQVTGNGYWEKRSLEESLELNSAQIEAIARVGHVSHVTPRLESFALVSHGTATKISPVVGIDPEREDRITGVKKRVVSGSYLTMESPGVLLAEGLARSLGAGVGDSVVLYGQGYRGAVAAAILPVIGIVKYPIPELNASMVFLPLPKAQWLYSAQDRLTGLVVMIDVPDALEEVAAELRPLVDGDGEVLTWKEMMPEVVQSVDVNNAGTVLMLVILYVVIGFGVFGTVMMMTLERRREFGILVGIGMNRWKLIGVTLVESLLVSVSGAFLGLLIGFPILYYFHLHPIPLTGTYADAMLAYGLEPILPVSIAAVNFVIQGAVVTVFGLISALYPLFVIRHLVPVVAIRGK